MTAITLEGELVPAAGHEAAAHHEEEHDRPGMNQVGLLLFMASEAMLFLAMGAARFYLAGTFRPEELSIGLGLVLTAILVGSSFAGYRGVGAISKGNRRGFITWIAIAVLLGVAFVGGVAIEWGQAGQHFPLSSEEPQLAAYSTAFFSMTGLHVFHLLQGLLGLVLLLWLGLRGHFGPGDHWGATAVVRFWTFVDIMWLVVVFPVLYLL